MSDLEPSSLIQLLDHVYIPQSDFSVEIIANAEFLLLTLNTLLLIVATQLASV